jgi:hypothetical protein
MARCDPLCLRRVMADGLDIIAVRIVDERAVIVRMIFFSQPGGAVVTSACAEGRLMERINYGTIRRRKRDVHRRFYRLPL